MSKAHSYHDFRSYVGMDAATLWGSHIGMESVPEEVAGALYPPFIYISASVRDCKLPDIAKSCVVRHEWTHLTDMLNSTLGLYYLALDSLSLNLASFGLSLTHNSPVDYGKLNEVRSLIALLEMHKLTLIFISKVTFEAFPTFIQFAPPMRSTHVQDLTQMIEKGGHIYVNPNQVDRFVSLMANDFHNNVIWDNNVSRWKSSQAGYLLAEAIFFRNKDARDIRDAVRHALNIDLSGVDLIRCEPSLLLRHISQNHWKCSPDYRLGIFTEKNKFEADLSRFEKCWQSANKQVLSLLEDSLLPYQIVPNVKATFLTLLNRGQAKSRNWYYTDNEYGQLLHTYRFRRQRDHLLFLRAIQSRELGLIGVRNMPEQMSKCIDMACHVLPND